MAAATACASTALAGQSLLKQSNELARNVNLGEARVTMRKSASKSAASGSIW
jgi:light-harvesting complex II chlorophyll a/b binding protein 1/light-harvesting complex II chlorophyll a/b binding protein 2